MYLSLHIPRLQRAVAFALVRISLFCRFQCRYYLFPMCLLDSRRPRILELLQPSFHLRLEPFRSLSWLIWSRHGSLIPRLDCFLIALGLPTIRSALEHYTILLPTRYPGGNCPDFGHEAYLMLRIPLNSNPLPKCDESEEPIGASVVS